MLTLRWNGFGRSAESASVPVEYEPVYGLPRHAVEEWLERNPYLREQYKAELIRRAGLPRAPSS